MREDEPGFVICHVVLTVVLLIPLVDEEGEMHRGEALSSTPKPQVKLELYSSIAGAALPSFQSFQLETLMCLHFLQKVHDLQVHSHQDEASWLVLASRVPCKQIVCEAAPLQVPWRLFS